jgi:hypothetical protein
MGRAFARDRRLSALAIAATIGALACSCGSGSTATPGPDSGGPVDGTVMPMEAGSGTDAGVQDVGTPPEAGALTDAPLQGATTDGGGSLCAAVGWCELSNTKLADVCPDPTKYAAIQANEGCAAVINDWSGAAADQTRNRLVIWGGGHHGYFGNEVYALDLNQVKMTRADDPSDVSGYDFSNCSGPSAYPDGRPVSRHTYDGLAYIADADKLFAFSGAKVPCGYQSNDTWTLDLPTLSSARLGQAAPWMLMNPSLSGGQLRGTVGAVSDYDPNTKRVIVDDNASLWAYDFGTNRYTLLNDSNAAIDYHMTARVDPKRKLFVVVGGGGSAAGGVRVFDIGQASTYAEQNWTAQVTGCDGLVQAGYPGLAYDPVRDKMVGWAGGTAVYLFDLDKKSCTTVTVAGGPGAQNSNGTMGRFRYFASLDVFAVVNDWKANAFTLRLP